MIPRRTRPAPRRRPRARVLSVLLGAALLAFLATALAFRDGRDGAPPAGESPVLLHRPADTPPALWVEPLAALGVVDDLSALADRAAAARVRPDLGESLAAATAGGRSPIAVVEWPTALRTRPGGRALDRLRPRTEFGSPRVQAVVGHEGGWLEVLAAELPNGRTGWIDAAHAEVGGVDYSLHADLSEHEVEVRRGGRVVHRLEVGIGQPETPTPPGVYAVTDKLRISGGGSPYGCCAVALTGHQPDIPQGWAGGDRLALHATSDETSVGLPSSLGCLRARGDDMEWLLERIPLGAQVVIAS